MTEYIKKEMKLKKSKVPKVKKITKGIHIEVDENANINETLCDDGNVIHKLYHISDIHISRFDDRHPEFMLVFKRLCIELKKDTQNALIVITGDILHEKNSLSPPQLMLAKTMFMMLSDIMPIIVIIGNHDISPQGNTIDAITPILSNLFTKNKIYLLLDDKNYHYNNCIFGLTTMFAKHVTPCITDNRNKIKIGLYHGMISGAKIENDFMLSDGDSFKAGDFKKYYDYVLLGDIHRHMYIDEKKTIAYAGSILQTRFGESLRDHGVLKWDLQTGKSELIKIVNDWGFVKLSANKDGIDEKGLIDMPLHPIIRLEYDNITSSQAEDYLSLLRTKYNGKCSLVRTISTNMDIRIGSKKTQIMDINDNKVVLELVSTFMKNNCKYDESITLKVSNKISEILDTMKYNYCNKIKNFTLKTLKFDNYFNYGSGNEINYTKMQGIVGISGNSYSGKSAGAVDALVYAIYGKSIRGDKFDVINITKKTMNTDVSFEINGELYRITRERKMNGKLSKKDSYEKTVLYKNEVNISKETIDMTNKEIVKIICEYEQFLNVVIMLQFGSTSFVDLPDKDRRKLVCGLLKLDVFNDILSEARSQINQINYFLASLRGKSSEKPNKKDKYDKNNGSNIIEEKLNELYKKYQESEKILEVLIDKFEVNKCDMIELNINKKKFIGLDKSVIEIKKDINNIKRNLKTKNTQINDMRSKVNELNNDMKNLNNMNDDMIKSLKKYKNINTVFEKFQKNKNKKLSEYNTLYEKLLSSRTPNTRFGNDYSKIKLLHDNECNNNREIKTNIKTYKKQIIELKSKIIIIEKPNKLEEFYKKLIDTQNEKELYIKEQTKRDRDVKYLQNKLEKLKNHEFDPECKFCIKYPVTIQKLNYIEEIDIINNFIENNKLKIIGLDNQINEFAKYQKLYDDYINTQQQNNQYNTQLEAIKNSLFITQKDLEISNNKLKEFEMYNQIEIQNKKIDKECIELKNKITEISVLECDKYNEYIKIFNKKKETDNNIMQLDNNINQLNNNITKTQNEVDFLNLDNKNKNEIFEKIQEYTHLNEIFEEKNKEYIDNETILNNHKKIHTELNNSITLLKVELSNAQKIAAEYSAKEMEKSIYEIIDTVLDKNGLIDDILSNNVIPKLEADVNNLLGHLADYKINISYSNGHFKLAKISGSNIINIDTLSGCERFICNVCFKLALDNYNNNIKTKFIIMDEVFSCCDTENIDKLPSLFNYMKKYYNFVIIISHDERIKKLYDTSIEVVLKKNESSIIY